MEVLFLALSAGCVAGQFVLSKCYQQKFVKSVWGLLVFPALTAVPAGLYMLALNGFALSWHPFSSPLALCFALIQTLSLLANVLVLRCGPLSVFSVFMMLGGMLLPYAYGAIFLKEPVTVFRVIGLILLLFALVLSCLPAGGRGREERPAAEGGAVGKKRGLFLSLCAAAFVLNGATSILFKVHSGRADALTPYGFQTWGFVFQLVLALASCLGFFLLRRRGKGREAAPTSADCAAVQCGRKEQAAPVAGDKEEEKSAPIAGAGNAGNAKTTSSGRAATECGGEEQSAPETGDKAEGRSAPADGNKAGEEAAPVPDRGTGRLWQRLGAFGMAAGYAVVSSTGGALNLLAAGTLPASMQYPFLTGGSVLLTTLASVLFFGEKFTPRTALLLGCLLAGTVLFLF